MANVPSNGNVHCWVYSQHVRSAYHCLIALCRRPVTCAGRQQPNLLPVQPQTVNRSALLGTMPQAKRA